MAAIPNPNYSVGSVSLTVKVLGNHQLLGRVFSFLDLDALKTSRSVSHFWSHEAARAFRHIAISLNPSNTPGEELVGIFSFLNLRRIRHTLTLSLLDSPWYSCHPEDPIHCQTLFQEYYEQNNNLDWFTVLTSALAGVPGFGDLVAELRTEVMLRDERDAEVFGEILRFIPKLSRLSLDLLDYSDAGVKEISNQDFPLRIKSLGIRIHRGPPRGETAVNPHKSLDPSTHAYLLGLCPSLEFLDFTTWPRLFSTDLDRTCEIHCLAALAKSEVCPQVKGVRAEYIITEGKCVALTAFPRRLEFLNVRIYPRNEDTLSKVHTLLRRHAPVLRVFQLTWHPDIEPGLRNTGIELNYKFPRLTTISLRSTKTFWEQEFNPGAADLFYLRDFFLKNRLKDNMSLLRNLELLFSISVPNQIWNFILPECGEDGKELKFPQIKTFSCSVVTGASDCESQEISRYSKIFPMLSTFQHVLRDEGKLYACRHRYRDGALVGRHRSKKYVTEYDESIFGRGYIDYELPRIIHMRPEANDCFIY